ncbi:aldo/keto reductase [Steroidobacter flavus]|uniref:Aldo/keto reductase n=1 Tax=Steroidobacter flavus TaxID=1842136 RepID=A0ABV8T056_9GAMM
MKYRTLGQGLQVSALGLGCSPLSGTPLGDYGYVEDDVALAIMHRAMDMGVTMFDSAECYGPWRSEEQIGRALKGRKREQMVIATKYGFTFAKDGSSVTGQDGSAANARRVCEEALRRLGTDYIDLYYLHRVDANVPIEESVGAMAELVREGKVRYLGLSEPGMDTLRRAHAIHPIAAVESEYSLWERRVEVDVLPTMRELGVALVPFAPLGRGFLTGAITSTKDLGERDLRRSGFDPRFNEGNFEKNYRMVEAVLEVARAHGTTGARIAIAWLLSKGNDIIPIPGVRKLVELEDTFGGVDVQLTELDIRKLEAAAPIGGTAGDRYSKAQLDQVRR